MTSRHLRAGLELALALSLSSIPFWTSNAYILALFTLLLIYGILLIGLDVSVGYLGQVNLAHAAFFGLGAYAAGISLSLPGVGLVSSLGIAFLSGLLFGGLLAIPALRLEGPQFALSTLSFSALSMTALNELENLTGGAQGLSVRRPPLIGISLDAARFYWLCLVLLILVWLGMRNLLNSRWGRSFQAVRDSPIATDAMGVGAYRFKMFAFAFGSALGGLAGGLHAFNLQFLQPASFGYDLMVMLLLGVVLGGRKSLWGAFIGATLVVLLPNLLSNPVFFRIFALSGFLLALGIGAERLRSAKTQLFQAAAPVIAMGILSIGGFFIENSEDWRKGIFALMLFSVVVGLPEGITGLGTRYFSKFVATGPGSLPETTPLAGLLSVTSRQGALLEIRELRRYFGGIRAVDGVSMTIEQGSVHGLIGPNGSGKSTLVNLVTGLYAPTSGSILLRGKRLPEGNAVKIARSGIARTFQTPQLFSELTALENVMVAVRNVYRLWLPLILIGLARQEEQRSRSDSFAFLELVGMTHEKGTRAKDLSYGSQRLLEIARALSRRPDLLILDEPAAGLSGPNIENLVRLIKKINGIGITILLIEHHMDVVNRLCDRVSVLDGGKLIAEGSPDEIRRNPKVIEAYLGVTAVAKPAFPAPDRTGEVVLKVDNLSSGYGSGEVLRGVSLSVRKNSVVALIGANGAGKTTLLRTLSGLVAPSGGKILLGGESIGGREPASIARLGLSHSPEGRRVFGPLTVQDNLLLGAYPRLAAVTGFSKGAESSLERVYLLFPKLKERRFQLSGTLSGGEQQMLAIGRALMAEPKIVLLDEPSMGLAPRIVQELFETIGALRQSGLTLLLVEQIAKSALEVSDFAYVLDQGRIAAEGTPDQLANDPRVLAAYLG